MLKCSFRLSLFFSFSLLVGCGSTTSNVMTQASGATAPAAAQPATAKHFALADIPFRPFNPKKPEGINVYAIAGNPGAGPFSAIVRFPAGFKTPLHSHDYAYDGIALSDGLFHGSSESDVHDVAKGSIWRQPAKEAHVDGCKGENFCYFLVSFEGPVNMVPEKAPASEPHSAVTAPDAIAWKEVRGGVKMATIRGDHTQGPFLALISFPAGMKTSVHTHTASFGGVLLSGTHHRGPSEDALHTLTPNSVWFEPAGLPHMEKCGAEANCVFFVTFDGALDHKDVVLTPSAGK
mgnify:CR=1 FL=1